MQDKGLSARTLPDNSSAKLAACISDAKPAFPVARAGVVGCGLSGCTKYNLRGLARSAAARHLQGARRPLRLGAVRIFLLSVGFWYVVPYRKKLREVSFAVWTR